MHRWLLAATAFVLGAGLLISRVSEIAASEQLETHSLAQTGLSVESSVYAPGVRPGSDSSTPPVPADFDAQINGWIASLSAQDRFNDWNGAAWTRYPLGAGMHGWLILLRKDGSEVGYLVVGAAEDGSLKLVEYGAGENPLFSMKTLYRSLIQGELIRSDITDTSAIPPISVERLYYSPLHAVWKAVLDGQSIYIDAVTGEQLPLSDAVFEPLQPYRPNDSLASPASRMRQSSVQAPFDPYDNTYWITDSPMPVAGARELLADLHSAESPVLYKANLYGKKVLAPFAVTGYHDWGPSGLYVGLEQQGARYVPFDVLPEHGTFHRQRASVSP
ncbi:hypothetical protein [Paenibacillus sp. GYB003]|uniref:hypothetical protein n=1 Tax=Paenibacillus sp. GYB003 TaxID=2994392 RepID=UPI002F966954